MNFKKFSGILLWKLSIWTPTNHPEFWLSSTFFIKLINSLPVLIAPTINWNDTHVNLLLYKKTPFYSFKQSRLQLPPRPRLESCLRTWRKKIQSKIQLFGINSPHRVWRENGEYYPKNTIASETHGGGNVMLQGCFYAIGTG